MSTISASSLIRRSKDVIGTEIDGEVVLLNVTHGHYHVFKGSAGRIWELTESSCSMQALCRTLAAEYEVAPERLHAETASFLEKLLAADLIELS